MNCTAVELNDVTILRRRLPRRQDSAEHDECYISVINMVVEFNDVVFRRRRLPQTEVFSVGVEEKYIAPRRDSVSAEQNNLTFRRPKPPRMVFSTEQDMNCSGIKGNSTVSEPCNHSCRRRSLPPNTAVTEVGGLVHKHIALFRQTNFPPNRVVAEVNNSVYKYRKFFRRPDPTPVVCAAGRNGGYIRSNIGTVPSLCNAPVTGSQALGSSHRLGRCCLWWTALPSHGIGSVAVVLILLLLLMVDSDDLNLVTLLIQLPGTQSHSMDNTVRAYSWILHGVRTLDGQMAEGNSPDLTCIQMIGTSVCYVSVLLLLQQFIRSRRLLFFRLMMTFSSCLHGFLRDQNFQTDRIPLTDITVFLNDKWVLWPRMNGVDLRNDKSGSADLLTSATDGSLETRDMSTKSDVMLCSWVVEGPLLFLFFLKQTAALIPPTLVDSGTGGRRLRVSDRNRSKFRYVRLGRMTVCVQKCRMICSQLRKSDA